MCVWYTTDFILHCMFSFVFQERQIWFLMLIFFILELFLVNDEAAQKTILSRRCFWASTFMILTTEIIKWLYESNGYDSLFMRRFYINRKPCRYLATALVLSLLIWKKWKFFVLMPFWTCFLVFSVFSHHWFIISSVCPPVLLPLLACAAFLHYFKWILCCQYIDFSSRTII